MTALIANRHLPKLLTVCCLIGMTSCGGTDGAGSGRPGVTGMSANDTTLTVGEDTRVDVDFEVAAIAEGESDTADVIVRIDPQLQYVEDSSRFDVDDTSDREPDEFQTCSDGSQLLIYHLTESDLTAPTDATDDDGNDTGDPISPVAQHFKFHVVGTQAGENILIRAQADELSSFQDADCSFVPSDDSEAFTVD